MRSTAGRSRPASGSAPDARALALRILRQVREGRSTAARLLAAVRRGGLAARDLALATEILYGTIRWRPALDAIVRRLSRRRPPPPEIADVLHLALYQVLFLDRVPAHAAVSRAVDQARALGGAPAAAFANALLREACRRGAALLEAPGAGGAAGKADALACRFAHPAWLVSRWLRRWDRGAVEDLLAFDQRAPEVALWPAPDRGDLAAALRQEGVETELARFVPGSLRARGGALQFSDLHARGCFTLQDEASQLVAWMFDWPLGEGFLDLCAGSGGKTAQLAAASAPGALRVATDRALYPLRRLRVRLRRLRLPLPLVAQADWEEGDALGARFKAVLLDAPCTGTGVLRRRPEIKERLAPADLPRLARRQRDLLEAAARRTAPRGELVYAVCSLEPEEGPRQIEAFLEENPEFERTGPGDHFPPGARGLLSAEGDLFTLPWRDGIDGFYAARLRRRS